VSKEEVMNNRAISRPGYGKGGEKERSNRPTKRRNKLRQSSENVGVREGEHGNRKIERSGTVRSYNVQHGG